MKSKIVLCLTVLVWDCASASDDTPPRMDEPRAVPAAELSLGGVSIGETEAFALTKLGTPRDRIDDGESIEIKFDGLTLWTQYSDATTDDPGQRRIVEISSTSPKFCTPNGICPGQDFAEVEKRFGAPMIAEREHGRFMEYLGHDTTCWLQIALDQSTIKSVRIECQP